MLTLRFRGACDVVEEAERGRGGSPAPGQQDRVEAVRPGARLPGGQVLSGQRDRLQGSALAADQLARITAGPVQQGELDQQLGADIPDVLHRRAQPPLGLLAALLGHRVDGPLRALARLDRHRDDEAGLDEAADRPVDDRPGNAPDPAELAVRRGELRDGESVRGPLAEQHQHCPLRQRHRDPHEPETSGSAG